MRRKFWPAIFIPLTIPIARLWHAIRVSRTHVDGFPASDPGPYRFGKGWRRPLNLLVLGDSTAVGVGATREESLPWLVASDLAKRQPVTMTNRAFVGARTGCVATKQLDEAKDDNPDIILVSVGSNDVIYLAQGLSRMKQVKQDFRDIIERSHKMWPEAKLVFTGAGDMASMPLFGPVLRAAFSWHSRRVNRALQKLSKDLPISYIPLAELIGPQFRSDPECFWIDKFHPSARGYRIIADELITQLELEGVA